MSQDNFTRAPRTLTPRERLFRNLRSGPMRETPRDHCADLHIEKITVQRRDCGYIGSGLSPTLISISLPRVKFLERKII